MRAIATAVALLLAPAALAAVPEPPPEVRALKEVGDQRRKAGDLDGALEAYRSALKKFGGYAEAHEAQGETLFAQKKFPEAIEAFLASVEIDPLYAFAWYNLAFAARKSGDLTHARTAYEKYVKLRPADPDGHYGFAETLRAQGTREPAIREYQLFVDLARSDPAQATWVEKARVALAELKAASAPAAPAVPSAPERLAASPPTGSAAGAAPPAAAAPSPLRGEGRGEGSPGAAVAPAATAVITPVAAPAVPSAPERLAASALPGGAGGAAASVAGSAPASSGGAAATPPASPPPGPSAAAAPSTVAVAPTRPQQEPPPSQALIEKLGAGDRAFLANDHRSALFLYQDAVYMAPTSVAARVRLARCYAALRYPAQAETQLAQALEIDPSSAEARKLLVEIRTAPARTSLGGGPMPGVAPVPAPPPPPLPAGQGSGSGTAYRFSPEPAQPSPANRQGAAEAYRAGVAQISQRDFALAVDSLNRALALDPTLAVAFEARASARFGLGQHLEAAEDYLRAARMNPERASPLWGLAECYRLLGDPRAAETYERYVASTASDATDSQREQARRLAQILRQQ